MTAINDAGASDHIPPSKVPYAEIQVPRSQQRRVLVRVGIGFSVLMALTVICGGLLGLQVASVRSKLEQTVQLVPQLQSQLEGRKVEQSRATFEVMRGETAAAKVTATGPLWRAASIVPFLGSNFRAVTKVAVSADDVVSSAVGPLLNEYNSLDWQALSPVDGSINVTQLREAAPALSTARNTVRISHERLTSVDLSTLLPQVADPIRSATQQLEEASTVLATASSAAQLLPSMLGTDEPRTYLVLIQNSAETRATGGIPGALAILNVDNGLITLGEQSSASGLGAFTPSIDVEPEQEALYTSRLGTQMQNVNLTPDFPTAAATAKGMWEERHAGQTIDGVLALDAVVLGYLLEATGPVDVTDPDVLRLIEESSLPSLLTKDNVVATLLSDVYREVREPLAQDAYFAAVANSVFTAFTNGDGDSRPVLEALLTSARENRLYVWSSRPAEQKTIMSTALAGSVQGPKSGGATFGVYYNDGTGAKMDYYATRTVQLLQRCQSPAGYGSYTVRTRVTNTAPLDAATTLPSYVTGGGLFGVDPGRIRTNYVFYGPAQSFVQTATLDGSSVPIGSGKHGQRPVGIVTIELGPRESKELDIVFSHVVQDSEPKLQVTPTLESPEETILPSERVACG
ncbi:MULTISPECIES: DUF4012 domain-containing protein [unclassified Arthrobacter]|uniref:DUF4012 domain-containing protein n=1 Tax=unclassified Arthrobacter TaxID=235627 RepID=UPI002157D3A6|nr:MULTISPECIES: DUF4012 domain-containing protein [unclassified Arthrobacter]